MNTSIGHYYERRATNIIKFYDGSRKRVGMQAVGIRLKAIFEEIHVPITLTESDCSIRLLLKKAFFNIVLCSKVPLSVSFNGPGVIRNADLHQLDPNNESRH